MLKALIIKLEALGHWSAEGVQASVQTVVDEHQVGFAKVAQPVRIAVTGSTMSPSIDATLALLGREKSMQRLHAGLSAFEVILLERN